MIRKLSEKQQMRKEVLLREARRTFADTPELLDDFLNEEWRLARVDADVSSLRSGDIVLARKEERPTSPVPSVYVFCPQTKGYLKLHTTDPVEFLED
jgi:hypothetical protein